MTPQERTEIIGKTIAAFRLAESKTSKSAEQVFLFGMISKLQTAPEFIVKRMGELIGNKTDIVNNRRKAFSLLFTAQQYDSYEGTTKKRPSNISQKGLDSIKNNLKNILSLTGFGKRFGISLRMSREEQNAIYNASPENFNQLMENNPLLESKVHALVHINELFTRSGEYQNVPSYEEDYPDPEIQYYSSSDSDQEWESPYFTPRTSFGLDEPTSGTWQRQDQDIDSEEKEEEIDLTAASRLSHMTVPLTSKSGSDGDGEDPTPALEQISDYGSDSEDEEQELSVTADTTQRGGLLHWIKKNILRIEEDVDLLERIATSEYNDPDNKYIEPEEIADAIKEDVKDFLEHEQEIEELVHEDIHGEDAFDIELEIPELIYEQQLKRFYKKVMHEYSNFSEQTLARDYNKDPEAWANSAANRARMVIIEATDDNIERLAKTLMETSPLERVVISGLTEQRQNALKPFMVDLWKEKVAGIPNATKAFYASKLPNASMPELLSKSGLSKKKQEQLKGNSDIVGKGQMINAIAQAKQEDYKRKLGKVFSTRSKGVNFDTVLANTSLDRLMGPHTSISSNDISFENMRNEVDVNFHSKIDEIVLYASDDTMAEQLPNLTKKAGADQSLAIKSQNLKDDETPYWTIALPNDGIYDSTNSSDQTIQVDAYKLLTSSKGANDIVSESEKAAEKGNNINGENPQMAQAFDESGLSPKQALYLKDMFKENSLYPNNLSPKLYASTITKAQSGLNGKGAVVVGKALPWAAIGRIIATAEGARFAVNSTMFDTANDINEEEQQKMLTYKRMFNDLRGHYTSEEGGALDLNAAFQKAAENVARTYNEIENSEKVVQHNKRSRRLRLSSFVHANRTNLKNEYGIKLIKPQPLSFLYGVVATVVGLTLAATGVGASIAFPIVGAVVFVGFTALLTRSLFAQRAANAFHLSRWHRLSARARTAKTKAQDERQKMAEDLTVEIKTTGGISIQKDKKQGRKKDQDKRLFSGLKVTATTTQTTATASAPVVPKSKKMRKPKGSRV